jgi:hypothetical protein
MHAQVVAGLGQRGKLIAILIGHPRGRAGSLRDLLVHPKAPSEGDGAPGSLLEAGAQCGDPFEDRLEPGHLGRPCAVECPRVGFDVDAEDDRAPPHRGHSA